MNVREEIEVQPRPKRSAKKPTHLADFVLTSAVKRGVRSN
jgi:hypothetical protein